MVIQFTGTGQPFLPTGWAFNSADGVRRRAPPGEISAEVWGLVELHLSPRRVVSAEVLERVMGHPLEVSPTFLVPLLREELPGAWEEEFPLSRPVEEKLVEEVPQWSPRQDGVGELW
jgi:hypothetical protein